MLIHSDIRGESLAFLLSHPHTYCVSVSPANVIPLKLSDKRHYDTLSVGYSLITPGKVILSHYKLLLLRLG